MDIHTACLNGPMERHQRIHMSQPCGYHAPVQDGFVFELQDRIYG